MIGEALVAAMRPGRSSWRVPDLPPGPGPMPRASATSSHGRCSSGKV